ncbi:ComEA family DNA-binding protein [Glaciecola sp. KUL10]|uniref:ComEA family DNA-binding protein n=1 Tax=Glaciecola sp. (strain KUL10) TaxID=2161813 RepID=UPI000D787BC1|nr:ComEA family DNA-binding protein [Glaciecola sp. KUL10]GBL04151.1 competence protein ComEA [Glaciecola sp. KUL10]
MKGITLNKSLITLLAGLTLACGANTALANAEPLSETHMQIETSAPINLNTANAEQLSSLPGIGAKKATQIIEYRELNGDFESVDELQNVKGIGPKMLAKISSKLSV